MRITTSTNEVKLLKDENWKLIQQNTFTRWVNQQLKQAVDCPQINNLETDFADGIILIKLSEVLSGRTLPRYNKNPTMRTQKLDNISLVLNFLQKEENIKIVNIDSSHIADRNLKLILGLIWTLILHYSLAHPHISVGEEPEKEKKKETPRQRLLGWIQAKLPHHPISNFTSNWNDGISLGALVDACLPTHFDEWREWSPENAYENTQKAMQLAEQALGIEKLITPEELINPNVDEKSVMTYLAQFPRAQPQLVAQITKLDRHPLVGSSTTFTVEFEKPNLRPEIDIVDFARKKIPSQTNISDDYSTKYDVKFVPEIVGEHKISIYAKDLENPQAVAVPIQFVTLHAIPSPQIVGLGNEALIGQQCRFQIENLNAHHQLDVLAIDPEGKEIILDACSERDENSVTCSYTPRNGGNHTVNVLYNKGHIPGSPFIIMVTESMIANNPDPEPLIVRVQSSPHQAQEHNSPALMTPAPFKDVIVWGRGILPKGTAACEEHAVHVDNCPQPVEIRVTKDHTTIPVGKLTSFPQPYNALYPRQSFAMTPASSGKYEVHLKTQDNIPLGKSPYKIMVGPKNFSSIRAFGPGLDGGIVGQEALFYVDTLGKTNQLEFAIEGPSETQIHCIDSGDGTALVKYTPKESGRYIIKIVELDTNTHIKDSPFVIWVDPADSMPFPRALRPLVIALEGLNENDGRVGRPYKFTIIAKGIEANTLNVDVYDPNLNKLELNSRKGPAGDHFSFMPEKEGKHIVSIVADKLAVDGWPLEILVSGPLDADKTWNGNGKHGLGPKNNISRREEEEKEEEMMPTSPGDDFHGMLDGDARLVQVSGTGLEHFYPGEPAEFVVDTSKSGLNTLYIAVVTSNGPTDELNVRHIGDGKYMVAYKVPHHGIDALVFIKYGDELVDGAPFRVKPVHAVQNGNTGPKHFP